MDETRSKKEDALPDDAKATTRIVSFDYLRSFVIILVLVHHAIIAYSTLGYINPENPIYTPSPVVDSQRWSGFDLILLFNDLYFMSLLFFISGFFVWRSLTRKGARMFLRDRFIRLGIPFVISVPLLIPLAYFPAQLEVGLIYGGSFNYPDFWLGMAKAGFPTAGPLWFLWLLLTFNVLIAGLYWIAPHVGDFLRLRTFSILNHPVAFFGGLFVISTVAYLPMVLVYGWEHWVLLGPFHFQTSRILHYLVYFLVGTAIGAYGLDRTMFISKSKLTRRWWVWMVLGLVSFIVYIIILVNPRTSYGFGLAFTVTCAATVLGVIAIFLRFTKRRMGILDNLSDNAYGIYIIHYMIVNWLQFWLLGSQLPAILKAAIVFTGTLILSWGSIAAIRRIPAVARVI